MAARILMGSSSRFICCPSFSRPAYSAYETGWGWVGQGLESQPWRLESTKSGGSTCAYGAPSLRLTSPRRLKSIRGWFLSTQNWIFAIISPCILIFCLNLPAIFNDKLLFIHSHIHLTRSHIHSFPFFTFFQHSPLFLLLQPPVSFSC